MNDLTEYARSLGYRGESLVLVLNGVVISHRNSDWFAFCNRLRKQS